jgi:preprotein translocase subunit YajC
MDNMWILAEAAGEAPSSVKSEPATTQETVTTATVAADPNGVTTTPKPNPIMQFLPFVLILVVMYILFFRAPKKKQAEHRQMVQSLQKNDKVQTIGGIIGIVVDVKDDEVTLKVDESNNTKIKVAPSAIGKNLSKQ